MPILHKIRSTLVDALSGPRIVFLHVPKCAGTSISRALRLRYPFSYGGFQSVPTYLAVETLYPTDDYRSIMKRVAAFREILLLQYLFKDVRCVSGHVRYSNRAFEKFGDRHRFITMLRDPISLMLSSHGYHSKLGIERWQTESDLESFLDSERARFLGSIYCSFFNGLPLDADAQCNQSIEKAKHNLRNLAVVGFVEDLSGFQKLLRETLGIRLLIGHKNRSRGGTPERHGSISADIRRKIEALSGPNMEIYEFARTELASGRSGGSRF